MTPRHALPLAVAAAVLAIPGTASANTPSVSVDCDGLTFDMSGSIAGSRVQINANEALVAERVAANQGDPIRLFVASPSPQDTIEWVVFIDVPWGRENDDLLRFTQPACVAVTTPPTPPSISTTTIPPGPSPTAAPTTTTIPPVVASTVPPTSPDPAAVVTTPPVPRPTGTTVPPQSLPVVGTDISWWVWPAWFAVGIGGGLLITATRGRHK
jgi:hypothetical protein